MAQQVKQWKSYAEQVEKLRQHGLIIDYNPAEAASILEKIGYYRLSGYAYPFRLLNPQAKLRARNQRLSQFRKGSCLGDIVKLYQFDCELRLLAAQAIELIEPAMQTRIAHRLGRYDPFAHEKAAYWDIDACKSAQLGVKSRYFEWQIKYQFLLKQSQAKTFVQHNFNSYGGLPIWVAIEIFDFGALSKLYAGMRDGDKDFIARALYPAMRGAELVKWLRALNFIRNQAAHHARLWNCDMPEKAPIPAIEPFKSSFAEKSNDRVFLYFCIIQFILQAWGLSEEWGRNFKALTERFPEPENKAVSLQAMGITAADWKDWPLWRG